MSFRPYTTMEKLIEVERLIDETRAQNREAFSDLGNRIDLLKAIAADLRGRLESAPSQALIEIERRMTTLHRRKGEGRDAITSAKMGIAEALVCRWPTIKQSLEKFGQDNG